MTAQPMEQADRARPGDDFEDFYRRVQPRLLAYSRTVFRDLDPEDITSETMARALEHFEEFHPGRSAWPWIVVVARRIACDAYRVRSVCPPTQDEALDLLPGDQAEPDGLVGRVERALVFEQALSLLTPRELRLLVLRLEEDFSHEQIAVLLDSTPVAVRQQFHRARDRFMACFAHLGGDVRAVVPVPAILGLRRWLRRSAHAARQVPALTPLGSAVGLAVSGPLFLGLLMPSAPGNARVELHSVLSEQRLAFAGQELPPRGVTAGRLSGAQQRTHAPGGADVTAAVPAAYVQAAVGPKPFGTGTTQEHRVSVPTPVGTLYLGGETTNTGSDRVVCRLPGVDCR